MILAKTAAPRAFAVLWKDMDRWSVNSFHLASWQWPSNDIKTLSSALERRCEPVNKESFELKPEHFISLRFTGNVQPRDLHGKVDFKGRLFFARAGDIIYSKIDVRNGAIGTVPSTVPLATVTSEFPVYRIKKNVATPEYIQLVFRTEHFRRIINGMVSGASGRKRVLPEDLEKVKIPIPPLAEQKAIVMRWQRAQDEIAAAWNRIERGVEDVEGQFLAELGLSRTEVGVRGKAFAARWQDFERWGVSFNRQDRSLLDPALGNFPVVRLSDVVADLENGWSPQCLDRPAELGEWGVLKLGAVSFGTFNENENKALPPALKPIPALEVKNGQVLVTRANITRLVGACAFIEQVRPRLMLCDKIFRVVFRENSPIEPAYLAEVMKIPQVRVQIESAATGTSATMQNITKPSLLALRLPLPPLPVQRQMIARSVAGRTEVAREREAVNRLTREMDGEVEAMILGSKNVDEL